MEKKKLRKDILFIVIPFMVFFLICYITDIPRTFTSLEDFKKAGGICKFEIPEGAYDCRYAYRHPFILSKQSLYSFVLTEEDYNEYIKGVEEDYKLPKPDDKYGYGHWYHMKVSDCKDPSHEAPMYDDFPVQLPFEKITDIPIEDYTIIIYYPKGIGTMSYGLLVKPEEYRIVCYDFESIR
ncbi:MAG: hypothetical protein K2O32_06420 [Acetatifactor sp.]|nr:hypothetical protein [Acetatifactor sp.]